MVATYFLNNAAQTYGVFPFLSSSFVLMLIQTEDVVPTTASGAVQGIVQYIGFQLDSSSLVEGY